jgi:5-methylcytosine-specific restriction endonuclease McrA
LPRRTARGPSEHTRLIQRLVEAQDRICPLCDDWLEFDPEFDIAHPLRPSVDHVVPRSKGGGQIGNLIAMHRECNCAKGDRQPTGCELIWLALVNARLGFARLNP